MDASHHQTSSSSRQSVAEHRRKFDEQMRARVASLRTASRVEEKAGFRSSLEDMENNKLPHVKAATAGGEQALSLATRVMTSSAAAQLTRIDVADLYGSAVNLQRAAFTVASLNELTFEQPLSPIEEGSRVPASAARDVRTLLDSTTALLLRILSIQRTQLRASANVSEGLSGFVEALDGHVVDEETLAAVARRAQSEDLLSLLADEALYSEQELERAQRPMQIPAEEQLGSSSEETALPQPAEE